MEYMPLLLRQFLGGSAPDLPPNEFKAYLLALAHIYEDEGPCPDRVMERHLTVKGWRYAKAGLIEKGRLFDVPGGVMDRVALDVLHDYHQQQLQASDRGRRAGIISAAKRRTGGSRQAAVADLFQNRMQATATAQKANEFSGATEQPVGKRAPARTRGKPDANDMQTGSIPDASHMVLGSGAEKPNQFNGAVQHPVNQEEREREEERTPLGPPLDEIELVEGQVEDDEFSIPARRSPERSIPKDWTPEAAQLSENVTNVIAEWPEGEFEREAVKFVEDAHAKDRRHRNWDRAFGVWLTRHDGYLNERRKRHERPSGWAETR